MLTRLTLKNFKRFKHAEIDLGAMVVFVGPNNSGKTSALQALALWELGLKRWLEKRGSRDVPLERPGITINRRDLVSVPIPEATLLWKDGHAFKNQKERIPLQIVVEGITQDKPWVCGLEFSYVNEESLRCKPLDLQGGSDSEDGPVPESARVVRVAYLPPMSGLAEDETQMPPGAIAARIGQGRTAEVLRNVCYRLLEESPTKWSLVCTRLKHLFGVQLEDPRFIAERGVIEMSYRDQAGVRLDLSCAGRGLQQTLLILAYINANPGAVLLLDEPDAHLEILRQQQIYQELTDAARQSDGQIVAASHSEMILNQAADRDMVVAFVGKPHRIDDRGSQVLKSLRAIGFDHYYKAEQKGWVLYLEGSTDIAVLLAFAETLHHPAAQLLGLPFVHYVGNQLSKAQDHFYGLREAKGDLVGLAILDRDPGGQDAPSSQQMPLRAMRWKRREIENYFCMPSVLYTYAERSGSESSGPLFSRAEAAHRRAAMEAAVSRLVPPVALEDPTDPWWNDIKASEQFLERVFDFYFRRLGLVNLVSKSGFHELARLVPVNLIDPEVLGKLDAIVEVAALAKPILDIDSEP